MIPPEYQCEAAGREAFKAGDPLLVPVDYYGRGREAHRDAWVRGWIAESKAAEARRPFGDVVVPS